MSSGDFGDVRAALATGAAAPEAVLSAIARAAREGECSPGMRAALLELEGRLGADRVREGFIQSLCLGASKWATGSRGAVAASSPHAASAGAQVLRGGGNAVDAACAAALALTVADPANASVAGRCHIVMARPGGHTTIIDAATQQPGCIDAPGRAEDISCVPVPGMLAGLAMAARAGASRSWSELVQPAIALAVDGFEVPPRLAAVWAANRDRLSRHPRTAQTFLKPDGAPYMAGEPFRQPGLGRLLQRVGGDGPEIMYRGQIADDITRQMTMEGGWLRAEDLAGYAAREGERLAGRFGAYTMVTPGAQAWGHTLIEMLHIADHFDLSGWPPSAADVETLAWIILVALADRPQELGTLRPKPAGLPLGALAEPTFAAERAGLVTRLLREPDAGRVASRLLAAARGPGGGGDTTHLSVMDAAGTVVSLTCSIGPSFGSAVTADPHGFLYAHSYRMVSSPCPGARDATEMCPAAIFLDGRPVMAVGAAGSERIPGAIAQTLVNLLQRRRGALDAVAAPRLAWTGAGLRVHLDVGARIAAHLEERGFAVTWTGRGARQHAGVVHLAQRQEGRDCEAAADPAYDGTGMGADQVMRPGE